MRVLTYLRDGLSHKNGVVRKSSVAILGIPRYVARWQNSPQQLAWRPPILANSFPKSGTHLLAQIAEGLTANTNFGAFLASQVSSFQLRERSHENTLEFIRGFVRGEVIRGHLYFAPEFAQALQEMNTVNYFIYRDPRDVVVSEAHYLLKMNRWHRLHRYFRQTSSIEEAILLSINGFDPPIAGIDYPNIAERFARYEGWLNCETCMAVRFEDLVSENREELLQQITEHYLAHTRGGPDTRIALERARSKIAPQKSHTFRSGRKAGWQREFTPALRQRFGELAGDLLIRLGYERDLSWVAE